MALLLIPRTNKQEFYLDDTRIGSLYPTPNARSAFELFWENQSRPAQRVDSVEAAIELMTLSIDEGTPLQESDSQAKKENHA